MQHRLNATTPHPHGLQATLHLAQRHISTGTLPCLERNRARPFRGGAGLPGANPLGGVDSGSDDGEDGQGNEDGELDNNDGFATDVSLEGVQDVNDEDDDVPLQRMVDDEYVDDDDVENSDMEEDPNDPFYNELLSANSKRRECVCHCCVPPRAVSPCSACRFLLRQYLKTLRPEEDPEEVYKNMVEENEEAGWFRFRLKLIDMNRIIKVTRQGRIQRFSAMVLVGNGEVRRAGVLVCGLLQQLQ